jgi:hypothetical protein
LIFASISVFSKVRQRANSGSFFSHLRFENRGSRGPLLCRGHAASRIRTTISLLFRAKFACPKSDVLKLADAAGRWQPAGGISMKAKRAWFASATLLSASVFVYPALSAPSTAAPQGKAMKIHRLYTGADGQTHAEEVTVNFGAGGLDPFKLKAGAGAEIRRTRPGQHRSR